MKASERSIPLRVHAGHTLLRLAAVYPTFLKVLAETVQNALDAEATQIKILLDLRARSITVFDNGEGVSASGFNAKLAEIAFSHKSAKKLGRFGLGVIAGLGKCARFTFKSSKKCPTHQWTFDTSEIEGVSDELTIPCIQVDDLEDPWVTCVHFERIVQDRALSTVTAESLADEILAHYNKTLLRLGTVIEIIDKATGKRMLVKGRKFRGREIPQTEIVSNGGKTTIFRMFLTPRGVGRMQGKVVVGEIDNDHTFPFADLVRSAREWFDDPDALLKALASGMVEGEILGPANLHENRREFANNENLVLFCEAIERWFKETGKALVQEEAQEQRENRYQVLGRVAIGFIEQRLLRDERLMKVLKGARVGHIGKGHADVASGTPGALHDFSSAGPLIPHNSGGGRSGSGTSKKPEERKSHKPIVAAGPDGAVRRKVHGSNVGLILHFEPEPTSPRLWRFDPDTGEMVFNILHPDWQLMEHSDDALIEFQQLVVPLIISAFAEEDPTMREWKILFAEDNVSSLVGHLEFKYPKKEKKTPGKSAKA